VNPAKRTQFIKDYLSSPFLFDAYNFITSISSLHSPDLTPKRVQTKRILLKQLTPGFLKYIMLLLLLPSCPITRNSENGKRELSKTYGVLISLGLTQQ
jgi:hypothetical protein